MTKSKIPYPHPKIFGIRTYRDWVEKAERDFERFVASHSDPDRTDHIINFAGSISHAMEWAFCKEVQGQPGWNGIDSLDDFRVWLKGHCGVIGQLETVNMASKHSALHSFVPQIDAGSASTTGTFSTWNLPTGVSLNDTFEGATIEDVQHVVVGGQLVDTIVSWSVAKLYANGNGIWFYDAGKQALSLWRQFDPAKGRSQTFQP